jgi:hypothetical protein
MKMLFDEKTLKSAKQTDILPLECSLCGETFYKTKKRIKICLNPNSAHRGDFCSVKCAARTIKIEKGQSRERIPCRNCGKDVFKVRSQIKKTKNTFCNSSCFAIYSNANKETGCRRSKLECWLQPELQRNFPNLDILFNDKSTIKSELDIYIPSLRLAIEINGLFHYKPIFGEKKFLQIQNNDTKKVRLCKENDIRLYAFNVAFYKKKEALLDEIIKLVR